MDRSRRRANAVRALQSARGAPCGKRAQQQRLAGSGWSIRRLWKTPRAVLGGSAGLVAPPEGSRTADFAVLHPLPARARELKISRWIVRQSRCCGAKTGLPRKRVVASQHPSRRRVEGERAPGRVCRLHDPEPHKTYNAGPPPRTRPPPWPLPPKFRSSSPKPSAARSNRRFTPRGTRMPRSTSCRTR